MKKMMLTLAIGVVTCAWAEPSISDVQMIQETPGHLKLSYHLKDEPAVVTLDVQTNYVDGGETKWASIGGAHLRSVSGDLNRKVEPGERLAKWNARKDLPGQVIRDGVRAVLTAWATNAPPPYMVIDLTKAGTDEGLSSLRFYADEESLPYGCVTNSRVYKSDLLVMRKIPAAHVQWWMGAKDGDSCTWGGAPGNKDGAYSYLHQVVLTEDFYLGVFEVTQSQIQKAAAAIGWGWTERYFNNKEDSPYRPTGACRWVDVRGGDFPTVAQGENTSGLLGNLIKKIGVRVDLPTTAQFEYAERAGEGAGLYTGKTPTKKSELDPDMDEIAWYKYNSNSETHEVGLKKPNAFGLYDMQGNVYEWCLEWQYNVSSSDTTFKDGVDWDPIGPTTGTSRAIRSGCYLHDMDYCRPFCNTGAKVDVRDSTIGMRLWAPAEVP